MVKEIKNLQSESRGTGLVQPSKIKSRTKYSNSENGCKIYGGKVAVENKVKNEHLYNKKYTQTSHTN